MASNTTGEEAGGTDSCEIVEGERPRGVDIFEGGYVAGGFVFPNTLNWGSDSFQDDINTDNLQGIGQSTDDGNLVGEEGQPAQTGNPEEEAGEGEFSDDGNSDVGEGPNENEALVMKILGLKVVPRYRGSVPKENRKINELFDEVKDERTARFELEKELEEQKTKNLELASKVEELESELVSKRDIEVRLVDNVIIMTKSLSDLISNLLDIATVVEREDNNLAICAGPFATTEDVEKVVTGLDAINEHFSGQVHSFREVDEVVGAVNKLFLEAKVLEQELNRRQRQSQNVEGSAEADRADQAAAEDKEQTNIYSDDRGNDTIQDQEGEAPSVPIVLHGFDETKNDLGWFCQCGLSYSTKESLRSHIKHYTMERKFKCTFCPNKFLFASQLRFHQQHVHKLQGNQSVGCSICGKFFSTKQACAVHRRIDHNIRGRGRGRGRSRGSRGRRVGRPPKAARGRAASTEYNVPDSTIHQCDPSDNPEIYSDIFAAAAGSNSSSSMSRGSFPGGARGMADLRRVSSQDGFQIENSTFPTDQETYSHFGFEPDFTTIFHAAEDSFPIIMTTESQQVQNEGELLPNPVYQDENPCEPDTSVVDIDAKEVVIIEINEENLEVNNQTGDGTGVQEL